MGEWSDEYYWDEGLEEQYMDYLLTKTPEHEAERHCREFIERIKNRTSRLRLCGRARIHTTETFESERLRMARQGIPGSFLSNIFDRIQTEGRGIKSSTKVQSRTVDF